MSRFNDGSPWFRPSEWNQLETYDFCCRLLQPTTMTWSRRLLSALVAVREAWMIMGMVHGGIVVGSCCILCVLHILWLLRVASGPFSHDRFVTFVFWKLREIVLS